MVQILNFENLHYYGTLDSCACTIVDSGKFCVITRNAAGSYHFAALWLQCGGIRLKLPIAAALQQRSTNGLHYIIQHKPRFG